MNWHLALIGHPVGHSRSPAIHRAFGRQFGLDVRYDLLDTEPAELPVRLAGLYASGVRGCNVTVPFKEAVFQELTEYTERGRLAGAINTLIPRPGYPGEWLGDNTDGEGFMQDLRHSLGMNPEGATVLILGAGGAVRGLLGPLLASQPRQVVIVNRTAERAQSLYAEFAALADQHGVRLTGGGYDAVPDTGVDLIVNGTSASLTDDLPAIPAHLVAPGTVAYDLMYAPQPTVFMRWARDQGAAGVADGLGMLVGQAAESFGLWTGHRPEVAPVMAELRGDR